MEKIQFKISINANAEKVYGIMLGQETFKIWTGVFSPSSNFEGSWTQGSKMLFTMVNNEGKREGMFGIIREIIPNQFVSIQYMGMLDGDQEITKGKEIEGWLGAFENYSFEESDGLTHVTVDFDVSEEMRDYFEQTYPKALEKLKEICEA